MSTKIYSGMKLPMDTATATQEDIEAVFEKVRNVLTAHLEANLKECFDMLPLIGVYNMQQRGEIEGTLGEALNGEIDCLHYAPKDKGTVFYDPLSFEMRIMDIGQPDYFLALPFTAFHAYSQALLDAGIFEDYAYWNNSDQPDTVSDEEWAQRKKDWYHIDIPKDTPGWDMSLGEEITDLHRIFDKRKDEVTAWMNSKDFLASLHSSIFLDAVCDLPEEAREEAQQAMEEQGLSIFAAIMEAHREYGRLPKDERKGFFCDYGSFSPDDWSAKRFSHIVELSSKGKQAAARMRAGLVDKGYLPALYASEPM